MDLPISDQVPRTSIRIGESQHVHLSSRWSGLKMPDASYSTAPSCSSSKRFFPPCCATEGRYKCQSVKLNNVRQSSSFACRRVWKKNHPYGLETSSRDLSLVHPSIHPSIVLHSPLRGSNNKFDSYVSSKWLVWFACSWAESDTILPSLSLSASWRDSSLEHWASFEASLVAASDPPPEPSRSGSSRSMYHSRQPLASRSRLSAPSPSSRQLARGYADPRTRFSALSASGVPCCCADSSSRCPARRRRSFSTHSWATTIRIVPPWSSSGKSCAGPVSPASAPIERSFSELDSREVGHVVWFQELSLWTLCSPLIGSAVGRPGSGTLVMPPVCTVSRRSPRRSLPPL